YISDGMEVIKLLCGYRFPIEYPHSWYDITSNKKFFSLAATSRGVIVGKIVAEIEDRTKSSSWTIFDYIQHIGSMLASLRLCSIPQSIFRQSHLGCLQWTGVLSWVCLLPLQSHALCCWVRLRFPATLHGTSGFRRSGPL
uniref:Uncharacterized protein n=1 Tax=Scleropages formosus TaxID=113540 RepID=A0A8C9SEK9_SCLFO